MITEVITPALDLFLSNNGVAGIGQCGHEGSIGALQRAGDFPLAGHFGLVQHIQTVVVGILGAAVQGVSHVFGGHFTALGILGVLEVDALADLEDIGHAVIRDGPAGGQGGHILGQIVVILHDSVADLVDDLAFIGAAVVDGVQLAGGGGQGHGQRARLAASAVVPAGRVVAAVAAAGQQTNRHRAGEGQCKNFFHRSFLSCLH